MLFKKAIGSVLAVALLVLVAVLSVLAFNSFFTSYQSNLMVSVENSVNTDFSPVIDALKGDILYLKNPNKNLTIKEVKINDVDCNISGYFKDSLVSLNVSSCISTGAGNSYNVLVVTPTNLYQKILSKD